jgi:hypothetical protein
MRWSRLSRSLAALAHRLGIGVLRFVTHGRIERSHDLKTPRAQTHNSSRQAHITG